MAELKDFLTAALGIAAFVGFLWLRFKFEMFLYERGWTGRRASKIEIQTLFHGNTKDQDQI